jgi:3-oxoacyl-[acyl-carrier-protein] synthase-1
LHPPSYDQGAGKSVSITGLGVVSPVGLSAPTTAAALRAGITRLGPIASSLVDGQAGGEDPATGGRVPLEWLEGGPHEDEWPGHERFEAAIPPPEHLLVEDGVERLLRLATPAVLESWLSTGATGVPPSEFGLFVGIDSEEEPDTPERLLRGITDSLGGFRPETVSFFAEGRASAIAAAHAAVTAIDAGEIDGAIVGGVDSLVRPTTYARLAEAGVIKDPDDNPQGILPGEAAAFLVLDGRAQPGRALARLEGAAVAAEPTAGTDEPNRGEGLTAAIRAARSVVPLEYMPLVICDLNGERYRALEWSMALTRCLGDLPWRDDMSTSGEFWHPADCTGDQGASSGALDFVWAVEALRRNYAVTERVFVWGASDGPLRGAAVVAPVT